MAMYKYIVIGRYDTFNVRLSSDLIGIIYKTQIN